MWCTVSTRLLGRGCLHLIQKKPLAAFRCFLTIARWFAVGKYGPFHFIPFCVKGSINNKKVFSVKVIRALTQWKYLAMLLTLVFPRADAEAKLGEYVHLADVCILLLCWFLVWWVQAKKGPQTVANIIMILLGSYGLVSKPHKPFSNWTQNTSLKAQTAEAFLLIHLNIIIPLGVTEMLLKRIWQK